MKWVLLLLFALGQPALAKHHVNDDMCKDVAKQIREAVDEGWLNTDQAHDLIVRCYSQSP